MAWKFVIADLAGRSVGEPRAFNRRVSFGVSRVATAGFRINDRDPLWDQVEAGESLLKVYDSAGNLRLYGPVVADEESGRGQGAQVQVAAADLAWRFGKRLLAKDTAGIGTTYTAQDSATIAHAGLTAINADEATGVTVGTADACVTRTITVLWKRYLDLLSELGAIEGSYEWGLRYVDGAEGAAPTTYLDLKARWGTDRSSGTGAVFLEYGTGRRNCIAYNRARTIDQLATDVWVLGGGGSLVTSAYNTGSRTSYGRHEDVINYGDITTASLLDALAAAHVAIRRQPRQIWSLTPFAPLAPRYGVDYTVGDIVAGRVAVRGQTRVAGALRAWAVDLEIDELGNERPTLRLTPET